MLRRGPEYKKAAQLKGQCPVGRDQVIYLHTVPTLTVSHSHLLSLGRTAPGTEGSQCPQEAGVDR